MKCIAWAFAVAGLLAAGSAQPASASPAARRVVVLTVDATTLSMWLRDQALRSVLTDGAASLLVARAGGDARDFERARRAAYATLTAGRRVTSPSEGDELRTALLAAGVPFFVSRSLQRHVAGPAAIDLEALPRPSVSLVAASDVSGCSDPSCAVAAAREALGPGDVLIVASPVPSSSRLRDGVWLSTLGMLIEGSPSGVLRSPTTRHDGVVALIDVAPTILSLVDARIPASMDGRPFERAGSRSAVERLRSIESDVIQAAHARRPATRTWMIAAMVALGCATPIVIGRGRRAARLIAEAGLAALPAVPAVLLVVPLLPPLSPPATAVVALVVAAVAGTVARALLRPSEAVAATAVLSASIALGDVLAGGRLAARSPLSYLITGGVRFYGMGNELMGVVVAGVIAAGSLLDRARFRPAARIGVPLVAALVVGVMAAPGAGAKLGSVLVAVPALAVLIVGLAERRLTFRLSATIGVFTVLVAGAFYAADRWGPAAAQSHIGRVTAGGIGEILARKVDAALGLAALSIWMQAILACLLVAGIVWRLRRVEVQALVALRPAAAAALKAAGIAVVLAPVTNDAGLIASAVVAVCAAALLLVSIGEEAGVRRRGSQAELGSGGSAPARPG